MQRQRAKARLLSGKVNIFLLEGTLVVLLVVSSSFSLVVSTSEGTLLPEEGGLSWRGFGVGPSIICKSSRGEGNANSQSLVFAVSGNVSEITVENSDLSIPVYTQA